MYKTTYSYNVPCRVSPFITTPINTGTVWLAAPAKHDGNTNQLIMKSTQCHGMDTRHAYLFIRLQGQYFAISSIDDIINDYLQPLSSVILQIFDQEPGYFSRFLFFLLFQGRLFLVFLLHHFLLLEVLGVTINSEVHLPEVF